MGSRQRFRDDGRWRGLLVPGIARASAGGCGSADRHVRSGAASSPALELAAIRPRTTMKAKVGASHFRSYYTGRKEPFRA